MSANNWQITRWVPELAADAAWANEKTTHTGIPGVHLAAFTAADNAEVDDRRDASVRGRLGYTVTPATLVAHRDPLRRRTDIYLSAILLAAVVTWWIN